jgi:DNA modification methylase
MNINEIKPNPSNPRIIKDDKFNKLVKSIQDFPQMLELRPIVIDENNIVLGGNMRLKACIEAGLKDVPVKQAKELTEEQKKEFIVKDNVGYGEWDWDDLANNWDVEQLTDWGLDIPDFAITNADAAEDDFDVPVGGSETDIVLGDIFEIGQHKLLCGSSTETDNWSKVFGSEFADLVVTDPPYNVALGMETVEQAKARNRRTDGKVIQNDKMSNDDFYQFLYDFYTALGSYTKEGGVWYVWHADSEVINFRKAMIDAGIMVKQGLIWEKSSLVMGRQDYQWQHEPCLYGWKEGAAHAWYSDRKQTTILKFDKPSRNADHPTMKPVELIAYQITNSSKTGDLVADGFLGSGTTMVAAHQLGRKCYGTELDPKYCQVIIDRMQKLDPSLIIKKNGVIL